MQRITDTWKKICENIRHKTEYNLIINDADYGMNSLQSLSVKSATFSDVFSVGNCYSKILEAKALLNSVIPEMAKIDLFCRISTVDSTSEWIQKGVYYLDERSEGKLWIDLTAYDAMMKTEQLYVDAIVTDNMEWPISMQAAVQAIATAIDVPIDDRTIIKSGASYRIGYPGDMSMREVLSNIAAAHGGNWMITDTGKLRLVPVIGSTDVIDTGNRIGAVKKKKPYKPVSKVIMYFADEKAFVAGTDTGYTLECDCIYATQDIANAVLDELRGYVYQPYEVISARPDPAIEAGDLMSGGGMENVQMAVISAKMGTAYVCKLSAPGEDEASHEYGFKSSSKRLSDRKVTLGSDYYGAKITRNEGLVIDRQTTDGKVLAKGVFNADELAFYKVGENGSLVKQLYFDPSIGQYVFVGDVNVESGSINIGENFTVDRYGNVHMSGDTVIYGGKFYAGKPTDFDGYTVMVRTGLEMYNADNVMKAKVGYADSDGKLDYPYVQLGSGEGNVDETGTIKKFANGIWIGNDAPRDATGDFYPSKGYVGMFFNFETKKISVVNGNNTVDVYTGAAIAKFG